MKANILQLIDIYYDALDAPKKGGQTVSGIASFIIWCLNALYDSSTYGIF